MSDIRFPYKDKSIGIHNGIHRPKYFNLPKNELDFIRAEYKKLSHFLSISKHHLKDEKDIKLFLENYFEYLKIRGETLTLEKKREMEILE